MPLGELQHQWGLKGMDTPYRIIMDQISLAIGLIGTLTTDTIAVLARLGILRYYLFNVHHRWATVQERALITRERLACVLHWTYVMSVALTNSAIGSCQTLRHWQVFHSKGSSQHVPLRLMAHGSLSLQKGTVWKE